MTEEEHTRSMHQQSVLSGCLVADALPYIDSEVMLALSRCLFLYISAHRRSQDFLGGGSPGQQHLAMHQWRTRLKLSGAPGKL